MYQRPSAPRPIGGVLDDSFRLYRASIRTWWLPSLTLVVLGSAVAIFALAKFGTATRKPAELLAMLRSPALWATYATMIVIQIWLYLAMFVGVGEVQAGRSGTIAGGLGRALRILPGALVAAILYLAATMVGTLLLVVPGLYVFGRAQFWPVAMAIDGQGPLAALQTSWRLAKGHWWRTATILTVLLIILAVLSTVLGMLAVSIAVVWRSDSITRLIVTQILSNAANLVMLPVFPAAVCAMYADLKLRVEGDDLEARLKDLPAA
jgi:hypothetical protein